MRDRFRSCVLFVLVASAGAVSFGGPFSPPDADRLKGVDPAIASRIEAASGAVRADPTDVDALLALAQTCEAAGLLDEAEAGYREALRIRPDGARHRHYLAQLLEDRGKLRDAVAEYAEVHRLEPGYVPAYLRHADLLFDLGRFDEAGAMYERAAGIDPGNPHADVGLSRVALRAGRPEEAIRRLEPRLGTPAADRALLQALARAYQMAGRGDDARQSIASAAALDVRDIVDPWNDARPQFRSGFGADLLRAETLYRERKYAEAIEIYERLRERHPDNLTVVNNLSVVYRDSGDEERALELMVAGSEAHPDYFPLHMNLAAVYEARNDHAAASRHLLRAIEIHPELSAAHERLAAISMRVGNFRGAYASFEKAIELGAGPQASLFAGQIALRLDRDAEALAHLREATRRDPSEIVGWLSLAQAAAATGEFSDAEAALARAREMDPSHPWLARIYQHIEGRKSAAGTR